ADRQAGRHTDRQTDRQTHTPHTHPRPGFSALRVEEAAGNGLLLPCFVWGVGGVWVCVCWCMSPRTCFDRTAEICFAPSRCYSNYCPVVAWSLICVCVCVCGV